MAQTASAADLVLKEFYVDKVPEAIKQEMPLSNYFKKRTGMSTDGRRVVYPIHTSRNSGVGARAESGNLPTAGQQAWRDFQIPYRFNHARVQLSAQALKQSKSSKGAFEKLYDAEIMGAAKDLGRDRNRQLFGFERGDLCHVSGSVSSSTTVTVVNGQGVADNDDVPARHLKANDIIAFIKSDGTLDVVKTVSSVAANLKSFVVTGSAFSTAEANEKIVRASTTADAIASTAYNNELMGLLGMIDDGSYVTTYHGIVRATYPMLNSYRISKSNGGLSLGDLQKGWDGADQNGNGKIKCLWGHHLTRREYLNLLQSVKRYVNEGALSPDAGFKGAALGGSEIEFNQVPFKIDRDAPIGIIFGLDDSYLFRYILEEGKWADEDGTILLRVSGSDDYEARYRVFDNFTCDLPNTCFVIDGIRVSTPEAIQVI